MSVGAWSSVRLLSGFSTKTFISLMCVKVLLFFDHKADLFQLVPEMRERFFHNQRIPDLYFIQLQSRRCKTHGHAMVFVSEKRRNERGTKVERRGTGNKRRR